jgi:hypothetical protein
MIINSETVLNEHNFTSICVIIPIYYPVRKLKSYEVVSISNTVKKFRHICDICLSTPENLDISEYSENFSYTFKDQKFPQAYFNSIYTYNIMLKSTIFFQAFINYTHILLVQTDAYIFSTVFDDFLTYSYVGAPWHRHLIKRNRTGLYCGNGGYSLRNIDDALKVIESDIRLFSISEMISEVKHSEFHKKYPTVIKPMFAAYYYLTRNSTLDFKNQLAFVYEDVFWSLVVPEVCPTFKVPDGETALKFGFETEPEMCYELNEHQLPTGCHGFNKYNPEFWKQFIDFSL